LDTLPGYVTKPYLQHVSSTDGLIEGHASADWAYVPQSSTRELLKIMGLIEELLAPTFFLEVGMPLAMNLAPSPGDEKVYLKDYIYVPCYGVVIEPMYHSYKAKECLVYRLSIL
jgi:hypothetical protein